ncbi:MAG: hypothetical protein ACKOCH_07985, partial [Bacteroidota bacterium]
MLKHLVSILVLLLALHAPVFSQQLVSGRVVTSGGEPVIGASVRTAQKSGKGAITDIQGKFSVE